MLIAGCSGPDSDAPHTVAQAPRALVSYTEQREPCRRQAPLRTALFGDLHVHTAYSFDAAANSLETYPAEAYRFAKGEAIPFFPLDEQGRPSGSVQLARPLDFVAVTDHAEFLGATRLVPHSGLAELRHAVLP